MLNFRGVNPKSFPGKKTSRLIDFEGNVTFPDETSDGG